LSEINNLSENNDLPDENDLEFKRIYELLMNIFLELLSIKDKIERALIHLKWIC